MKNDSNPAVATKQMTPMLCITHDVLHAIFTSIGRLAAETGGAIGGDGAEQRITHFHFDESSHNSAVTYSPDHMTLNRLFQNEWNPHGVRFQGIVHSHPGKMVRPSPGDEQYAKRILEAIDDLAVLWLPIVNTVPNTGEFRLTPWAVYPAEKGVTVIKGKIQVIRNSASASADADLKEMRNEVSLDVPLDEIVIGPEEKATSSTHESQIAPSEARVDPPQSQVKKVPPAQKGLRRGAAGKAARCNIGLTFDRVKDAYDLELMNSSRVIAVGAGGAAAWIEDLARAGFGQFILIDPDVVSETNLATQQTYRRDIGSFKVDCIADRIRDINPTAVTVPLHKSLDDLSDTAINRLGTRRIVGHDARRTVICGFTDSFWAQARVNRLALQFGWPSLCAQVYQEGRGAEITFTHPGVTPACHRCILSSRYRYYLEEGKKNTVTSHGAPIFSTARLNAIKGFVMMALIHHGSSHPRWGAMLSRIGKRNLIQIRMDPDFSEILGLTVFDQVFESADKPRLFFDESVWLPQDPECPQTGHPPCPDCGGTGNLQAAIGTFQDTKLVPAKIAG